ncbi:hypothetical protein ACHWQZ_G019102 [Mnemiopsis leidyi]
MVKKKDAEGSETSTRSTILETVRSDTATNVLLEFTPHNVSYFKKYASYMSRNAVKPLEDLDNELVTKNPERPPTTAAVAGNFRFSTIPPSSFMKVHNVENCS